MYISPATNRLINARQQTSRLIKSYYQLRIEDASITRNVGQFSFHRLFIALW